MHKEIYSKNKKVARVFNVFMKAKFPAWAFVCQQNQSPLVHAGGLSPDLEFWLQAEQELREQTG
jgi:hypothetical protein